MHRYENNPTTSSITVQVMQSQREWGSDRAATASTPFAIIRAREERRESADVRFVGRTRCEGRSYFWIRFENGDERGIKVSEQPKDIQRWFKPFDRMGKPVDQSVQWIPV